MPELGRAQVDAGARDAARALVCMTALRDGREMGEARRDDDRSGCRCSRRGRRRGARHRRSIAGGGGRLQTGAAAEPGRNPQPVGARPAACWGEAEEAAGEP